jgi:hypothetical protein
MTGQRGGQPSSYNSSTTIMIVAITIAIASLFYGLASWTTPDKSKSIPPGANATVPAPTKTQ